MITEDDLEVVRQTAKQVARGAIESLYVELMEGALMSFPTMPHDQCSLGRAFQKAVNRATELRLAAILRYMGHDPANIPGDIFTEEFGIGLVTEANPSTMQLPTG